MLTMALLLPVFAAPNPVSNSASVSTRGAQRVTAIADGVFRVQHGPVFDERPSFSVVNRYAPAPRVAVNRSGAELVVRSGVASVAVSADGSIVFACRPAAAQEPILYSWKPGTSSDAMLDGMPISSRGMYAFDDSATARLGGGDATRPDWWAHPLNATDAPPPASSCANPRPGVDVGPGATRNPGYPAGIANASAASCCQVCDATQATHGTACVGWMFAGDSKTCWLFSTVASLVNTNQQRTYGGAGPPPPSAPSDVYFLCYGNSGPGDYARGAKQLALLTGAPPLMPLAAYGVWYSGCCIQDLYNESAVANAILAPYKVKDLPLDFFVFDFFWHRKSTGWGGYSWSESEFPDWKRMLANFKTSKNAYGHPFKMYVLLLALMLLMLLMRLVLLALLVLLVLLVLLALMVLLLRPLLPLLLLLTPSPAAPTTYTRTTTCSSPPTFTTSAGTTASPPRWAPIRSGTRPLLATSTTATT